jgi:hypothetical protein
MSYPFAANRLSFFEPIMAVSGTETKPMCAIDIGASNATHGEFVCVVPCTIRAAKFSVTLENVVGSSSAPYVILTKYATPGAGGSSTVIGTITVPTSTAIGSVIYKKDLAVSCAVGDVVQIKHVVGVGSPAGMGNIDWYCEPSPEVPGNNSDMAASST